MQVFMLRFVKIIDNLLKNIFIKIFVFEYVNEFIKILKAII